MNCFLQIVPTLIKKKKKTTFKEKLLACPHLDSSTAEKGKKKSTKNHLGFITDSDCLDTTEIYKKAAEGKKNGALALRNMLQIAV